MSLSRGSAGSILFLSPAKPAKLISGAGLVYVLPTATNKVLGKGKFSVGPSVVALVQPGK